MRAVLLSALLWAAPALAEPSPPAEAKATGWRVRAVAPRQAHVGQRAELEILVEAQAGYHLNDDYPMNFRPTGSDTARFDAPRVDRGAATLSACTSDTTHMCSARMPVAFVAGAAGQTQLGGTLAFSACSDAQCLIQKVQVSTRVSVVR